MGGRCLGAWGRGEPKFFQISYVSRLCPQIFKSKKAYAKASDRKPESFPITCINMLKLFVQSFSAR